ncbi:uncharacterized protein BDV14DRAFT_202365 [Aspergillus stella-maris]|uniref:uncharacterized protein n=1 Tax=Aspergillus stella-maris TaxID=1810926 RepID=UPI003CCDC706
MSTYDADDYLDDLGLDIDTSYGLDDYDVDDFDIDDYLDDYLPTSTGSSSSYPTSSSYDYDDYDYTGVSGDDRDDDDDDDVSGILSSSDFDLDDIDDLLTSGDVPSEFAIGGDYSYQETSKTCVSEAAFKTTGPKVDLAFNIIFLVLFIALAGIAGFRLLKSKNKGSAIAKWFLFPASLFFAILYLFIDFLALILSQCLIMRYDKYQQTQTATTWFENLSVFLLIVLILLPICLKLQGSGKFATLTLIIHGAWLALTSVFLLISLAVYTGIQDALYRTGDNFDLDLIKSSRGVSMVYYVFLFLAALLGGANMFFALLRSANIRRGTLLLATPTLALSTLILTLTLMCGFADREYGSDTRSATYLERSGDAQDFLSRFFYAIAFLSALFIAGSKQIVDDGSQNGFSMGELKGEEGLGDGGYHQPQLQAQPVVTSSPLASNPVPAPMPVPVTQYGLQQQQHPPVPVPAGYGPANVA